MIRAIKPFKRARLAVIAAVAGLMIMIGSPAAQAYWDYRYFDGASYQNQYWSSASGTDSGGRVYVGIDTGGYGFSNYEYTATYDSGTGYWLASASGDTGSWTNSYHTADYSAFEQCWWNSNYGNPGQPAMACDQFRD